MVEAMLVSASAADDAALLALRDLSEVLGDEAGTGVIGGHMVSLLTASFPSPGFVERRTNDADGGIPMALARSGDVHRRLIERGYHATGGNRYEREVVGGDTQAVDLLVPNLETRLRTETIGSRQFDSMPGLGVVLAGGSRLQVDVIASLRTGEELRFTSFVPGVEGAVILKSYAWSGRRARKDAIDLHSLFCIVENHPPERIGGWRLNAAEMSGVRLDTSRTLHELARRWEAMPPAVPFDYRLLIASIRTRVTRPGR